MSLRVATDVGGTFTDLVAYDETTGRVHFAKVPTTPPRFADGVLDALEAGAIDLAEIGVLLHGCTVVINAITERTGARTALVTTRGFRDVLEIARGNRPDMYDMRYRKPEPFVPRRRRFEVDERLAADGTVVTPLGTDELREIAQACRAAGVEAIAVCLLHAYANPAHERAVGAELATLLPGIPISLSCDVAPQWREYERSSTTVLNAYVQPVVERYLEDLDARVRDRGLAGELRIMESSGGTASVARARTVPVHLVESGPAGGIAGAAEIGRRLGEDNVLYLDIGGTTAKCTLIRDGVPAQTTDYHVERTSRSAGIPISVPVVDIVEIGAGGGSLARVAANGTLTVGPQSAGAVPGPACYGRGGSEPTVTDAMVVAGVIDPADFLGGEMALDADAAWAAIARLGAHLGLDPARTAGGVLRLANARMHNALRLVSVHRGHDPRDFTLVASGGGGPLHAVALGAELQVRRTVIPPLPGAFSAWGMLVAEPRVELARTYVAPLETLADGALLERFAPLEEEALALLGAAGGDGALRRRFALEMRYRGQEHGVEVELPEPAIDQAALHERFHAAHERRYTFALPGEAVEVVALRLGVARAIARPQAAVLAEARPVRVSMRSVDLTGTQAVDYAVVQRAELGAGFRAEGPVLVREPSSTTVVPPGHDLEVDALGNLIVSAR
jgi:N-methylhydantoinase A